MVDTAYTTERQDKWFEVEDKSWWFRYRIHVFYYICKKYFDRDNTVYDIGGSNGYNSLYFQNHDYKIILLEPTYQACINAKERGVRNVINSDFQNFDGYIQNFMLLDVLEHIKDDKNFMRQLFDKMEQDCYGIISVPASRMLWSSEDVIDGHYRRYDYKALRDVITGAGFKVCYINKLFMFLWLPIYIRRHLMEKIHFVKTVEKRSKAEEDRVTKAQFVSDGIVGIIISKILRMEYKLIKKGYKLPFGSSIFCIVKKC